MIFTSVKLEDYDAKKIVDICPSLKEFRVTLYASKLTDKFLKYHQEIAR